MRVTKADVEAYIAKGGRIGHQEVLAIRRQVYPDGVISAEEAEWLFTLDERFAEHDEAWARLFVEALTDLLVNQMQPQGHVTPENMQWLLSRITRDEEVKRATELELLVTVLEKAISAPDPLAVFTLQQVKAQVLRSNRLGEREAELPRRVLYAAGGQQNIAVTRLEAEVLYDIHDARSGLDNDPAWDDLFVKAVLSHLMFVSGYQPPTREEALRRDAWLNDTGMNSGRFLSAMAAGLPKVMALYREPGAWQEHLHSSAAAQAAAEQITDEEAGWLAERMLRDGSLSPAERLLVDALRREQPRLHPLIQAAVDKLG